MGSTEGAWWTRRERNGHCICPYNLLTHDLSVAKTFQQFLSHQNLAARKAFDEEARVWNRLGEHPNIARAHGVVESVGIPFMLAEYVPGGDLAEIIRSGSITDDVTAVLKKAIDLCTGMRFAVEHGLSVHCDIKPANCLIDGNGTLKVTDFGLRSPCAGV